MSEALSQVQPSCDGGEAGQVTSRANLWLQDSRTKALAHRPKDADHRRSPRGAPKQQANASGGARYSPTKSRSEQLHNAPDKSAGRIVRA